MRSPARFIVPALLALCITISSGTIKHYTSSTKRTVAERQSPATNENAYDPEDEENDELAPEMIDWSDFYIDSYLYNYSAHKEVCAATPLANDSATTKG